jgi:hypothetical protein
MFFLAKNNPQDAKRSRARPTTNVKLWQHISRRADSDAAENKDNDVRRFYKRVKTAITSKLSRLVVSTAAKINTSTERSDQASPEYHEPSRKTHLLRPLKEAWRKAIGKPMDNQSRNGKVRRRLSLSVKSSILTTVEEDKALDASLSSPVTDHARLPEPLRTCTPSSLPLQSSQIEMSATLLPVIQTSKNYLLADRGHSSTAPEESYSLIAYHDPSQLQSSSHLRSIKTSNATKLKCAAYDNASFKSTRRFLSKRQRSRTLSTHQRTSNHHPSTTSTWTSSPSSTKLQITSADLADYDRIMKVFHPTQASRIPIPVAWRHITPRAYCFRGPSSPYRNIATTPARPRNAVVNSPASRCITEPRRRTRHQSQSKTLNSVPILQAIAARPASYFPAARAPVTETSSSYMTAKRHVAGSTLGRRLIRTSTTRLKRQKTLPLDWRLKNSLKMESANIPPMPTRVRSGSVRSRFLPPVTLDDPARNNVGEDDVRGKVDADVQESSIGVYDSGTATDDDNDWESFVSGEEVWFEASEVAVVNEPLH